MKKSVVCGVDGSAGSQAALAVAAQIADELGARLVLANVVEYVHSPTPLPALSVRPRRRGRH